MRTVSADVWSFRGRVTQPLLPPAAPDIWPSLLLVVLNWAGGEIRGGGPPGPPAAAAAPWPPRFSNDIDLRLGGKDTHLSRNQIESNLSVPGIQGCHENALFKRLEMSPHFICLCASTNIPLGPA